MFPILVKSQNFFGGAWGVVGGRWHGKVILDPQGNEKTQHENGRQEEEWKIRTAVTLPRLKGQK